VDIDEGDRAVSAIKRYARATFTKGVLTDIGSFGACYQLTGFRKPVLVSSADGVGTKLKVAFATGRHDTVGEDLVNHCVNDIAVQGAVPLFFLDYFAVGKLQAEVAASVVSGIARGCKSNGCALIGGETAEMPGLYAEGEYDLAGFIVGAAERSGLMTGAKIREGDVLLGLPSTGLHTNGYSLARKLLFEIAGYGPKTLLPEVGTTVADALLAVHRSYLAPIRALMKEGLLRGAAHITGGGITDNTPRILPKGLAAAIDTSSWKVPAIFEALRGIGNIPDDDYRRTFNLGVGMILAVPARSAGRAEAVLRKMREPSFRIGTVVAARRGRPRVEYR
jgi:phosphoribosylformylglycinamidine cyclo-ligase